MRLPEKAYWFSLLIPGFISLVLARSLSDFPELRDVDIPISYLLLTFVNCGIPLLVVYLVLLIRRKSVSLTSIFHSPFFIMAVAVVTVFNGLFFAAFVSTDTGPRLASGLFGKNLFPIESHVDPIRYLFREVDTENFPDGRSNFRKADGTPYFDHEFNNRYVRVVLKSGATWFEGVPKVYHTWKEKAQLYISPACTNSSLELSVVPGGGVWLSLDSVSHIYFIDGRCSACALALEEAAGMPIPENLCPYGDLLLPG